MSIFGFIILLLVIELEPTWNNAGTTEMQFGSRKRNRYLYIKLNPNPAREKISVQLYGLYSIKTIESFYIMNYLGNKVLDATMEARKMSDGAKSFFDVYISSVKPGTYFVVLQADEYINTKKFSIVR
jgi:hypothetical protein